MTEDELQAVTVRFPLPVYEQLRKAAFDQRRSMAQIVIAAVAKELKGDQS